MKPAIATILDPSVPFARLIPMIADAGFEAICFGIHPEYSGYSTREGRRAIEKLLSNNNLTVDSIHAPMPGGDHLFSLDEEKRLEAVRQCRLSLETAKELAGRGVVIHLLLDDSVPEGEIRNNMIKQGRISVMNLVAYAEECGVFLALENGQSKAYDKVLTSFLAEFTDAHVGFCYDTGHENVQKECFKLLEKYNSRLVALHIHDNTGADTHVLPYTGNIDWDQFRSIIHNSPYDGNLLLEVMMEDGEPSEFLARARKVADQLMQKPGE